MRIACLQFNPQLGKLSENIARANEILETASHQDLDFLVLPELAFTGYNHPSQSSILPYLEPTSAGPSTAWAVSTAARLACCVTLGYPEILATPAPIPPDSEITAYNSAVTVSPTGRILAHYRKTHLYYTDETWANESPTGWLSTPLAFVAKTSPAQTIKASFGICMDLNPKQFKASWQAYEFSSHALVSGSEMLVLSMAWLTRLESSELGAQADQPDLDTLSYWIERLTPVVEGQKEVVVVCANRCGEEGGKNPLGEEEGVRYAGTSWVGLVGNGLVRIWGIMGRAAEGVLVVDTAQEPQWVLRMRGRDGDSAVQESCRFGVGENSLLST